MYRKQRADGRGRGDARLLLLLGQRPYLTPALLLALGVASALVVPLPPAIAPAFGGTVRARP